MLYSVPFDLMLLITIGHNVLWNSTQNFYNPAKHFLSSIINSTVLLLQLAGVVV
jgi:hypothetical protein